VWVLAFLLLLSALGVVFIKDNYRRSYLQYQSLEQQQVKLTVRHNRLLLENATRLAQSRLATLAKRQGMVIPSDKQTVWLRSESDDHS
jgi:cell division protein FtsL